MLMFATGKENRYEAARDNGNPVQISNHWQTTDGMEYSTFLTSKDSGDAEENRAGGTEKSAGSRMLLHFLLL